MFCLFLLQIYHNISKNYQTSEEKQDLNLRKNSLQLKEVANEQIGMLTTWKISQIWYYILETC